MDQDANFHFWEPKLLWSITVLNGELKDNVGISKIENFKERMEKMLEIDQTILGNKYADTLEKLLFIIRIQELILKETTDKEKQELRERLLSMATFYTPRIELWKNGYAITNGHKIKDTATAEEIRQVFFENKEKGYKQILNAFKSKSKKTKSPKKSTSKKTKSPKKSKSKKTKSAN
jgi:hypothetical protein